MGPWLGELHAELCKDALQGQRVCATPDDGRRGEHPGSH